MLALDKTRLTIFVMMALAANAPGQTGMKVETLEKGAEPRTSLHIKAPVGTTQSIKVITQMDIKASSKGKPVPATSAPVVDMRATIKTEKHATRGFIQYLFTVHDLVATARTPESKMLIPLIETQAETIRGKSYRGIIDTRGARRTSAAKQSGKDEVATLIGEQAEKIFTIAFPAEPIGPGGKWRIIEQVQLLGAVVDQTTTVQLVGRKGDMLTLKLTMEGSAEDQRIKLPNAPQNLRTDLLELNMSGTANVKFDLRKPAPSESDAKVLLKMKVRNSGAGEKAELEQNYVMSQSIREAAAAEIAAGRNKSEGGQAPPPPKPAEPTPDPNREADLKMASNTMDLAREAWKNKEYQDALTLAEKALDYRLRHVGLEDPECVQINKMVSRAKEILTQEAGTDAPSDAAAQPIAAPEEP